MKTAKPLCTQDPGVPESGESNESERDSDQRRRDIKAIADSIGSTGTASENPEE